MAHRPIVMTGPCHWDCPGHRRSTCGQRLDWATSASLENSSFWWCGGRWTASVTSVHRRAWISASSESFSRGCWPCHSTAKADLGLRRITGTREHVNGASVASSRPSRRSKRRQTIAMDPIPPSCSSCGWQADKELLADPMVLQKHRPGVLSPGADMRIYDNR